jgi:excisionase family DNA binding protein
MMQRVAVRNASIDAVLLSIPQAAVRLGTSTNAIRHLIWRGELSFVPLGKRHLVSTADLDRWIEVNKRRNGVQ